MKDERKDRGICFKNCILSPAAVEYREWQMLPHVPWPCRGDCVPWFQSFQYTGGHRQYGHHRQTLECGDWHRTMHTHCEFGREEGRGAGERDKGRRGKGSILSEDLVVPLSLGAHRATLPK